MKTSIFGIFLLLALLGCGGSKDKKDPPVPVSPYGADGLFQPESWSGEYRVGTTTYSWQDLSRAEPHTANDADVREVQVRLFYPTDQQYTDNLLAVLPLQFWERVGSDKAIPGKQLRVSNYLNVMWDVEIDATISDSQPTYPLIIFSNGYGFTPENHVNISAELASRGYIVASVNHPYGSGVSRLLDGSLVYAQSLPENNLGADLKLWSDDQIFVLNQMQDLSVINDSLLYEKLDHRIATMGHSYGGAAAYYSAWQDERVLAAVNLDGTVFDREGKNINQPFMYVQNDLGYDHNIFEQVNNDGYAVVFQNQITHQSFADYVLFWEWDFPNDKPFGPMDSKTALTYISAVSDEFFDLTFNGGDAPYLTGDIPPPENTKILRF